MITARRWGLFEAPADPPAGRRLRLDPTWSPARMSREIIRREWRLVLAGSLLLVSYNVAMMLVPVVVGSVVDTVVQPLAEGIPVSDLLPLLAWWCAAVLGLYLVINFGYRFGGRLGWLAVQRSQFEVAQRVLERVLDERGIAGPPRASGGLLSVATGDAHRACLVLYVTIYPPGQAIGLLVAVGALFTVHPWLGIGAIVGLPVAILVMHALTQPLRKRSQAERAKLADAAASAADLVAGYRVLRGLHAHDVAAGRYRDVSRRALDSTVAARSAKAWFDGVGTGVSQLFAVAVVIAAAVLAFNAEIGAGGLATVAGVAVAMVQPLNLLVNSLASYWAIAQASTRRVLDLIGTAPNPASLGDREVPAPSTGIAALEFRGFPVADGARLDARIEQGSFVVLDLPHASHGRLAEVLAARASASARMSGSDGVAGPAGGPAPAFDDAVRVFGMPVGALQPAALRERILVVPHAPGILSGTVLDNVRATGDEPRREDAAREALRVASLEPAELPDRYDTGVGDDGWELSGGQRQRIALARAVAAAPDVLVLVEPTTSVDAVTEQRIAARLADQRVGRTTLVVTSSPAFHAVADRVLTAGSARTPTGVGSDG
ncbi:hypothetical protein GCM10011490_17200 [Pseudoclavibacter endophyticus]|nr:hypothetical protein GCM10011490_17200 [Pseudoclavibacter endophyticus]